MDIEFVAGFGPIAQDVGASHGFWSDIVGIPFEEAAPDYFHTHDLAGTKAFAIWPLAHAAEATFGTTTWPADLPTPQSWLELEVGSPEAVGEAVEELRAKGQRILVEAHTEPWGQTTARLLSPEGLLVGISYLPSFHE
jgi:catechol 2,3-dioxygenase-like lactoylglutathione lyase family enzyme